jgi:SH3 domain-containing YSC84-like protein 1
LTGPELVRKQCSGCFVIIVRIGADASAAAGPVGRDAGADTDLKMKAEMLTYSRARGLFAGVDLSGLSVTQDKDETRLFYGKFIPFEAILKGEVRSPGGSGLFEAALRKYANQAGDHGELKQPPTVLSPPVASIVKS